MRLSFRDWLRMHRILIQDEGFFTWLWYGVILASIEEIGIWLRGPD